MWLLLLVFFILKGVNGSCPDGFELVSNGQCRGFYTQITPKSWEDALSMLPDKCKEMQGQPVTIHNEEQQEYWRVRANDNLGEPLILGLITNQTTHRYEWLDGSPVDYKPEAYDNDLDFEIWGHPYHIMILLFNGYWDSRVDDGKRLNMTVDIYCTTQLQQPTGDGCASFDDDKEDGVCYQVGVNASNWQDAQIICRNSGADLASIHNQQENSFVRRLAVSTGAVNGLFLGGTVSGKGKDFGWIDGSAWDYDNFYPGFPIDGLGECLIMDTLNTAGQWMNMDCTSQLPVACSRPRDVVPACTSGPWKEGQIMYSPGYPYDASIPCDYFLTVDAGKRVQVEVKMLEANTCCDHLILTDSYAGGKTIANLTGELSNKVYTSDTNFIRVTWQPNGGVNVRGMMMTFTGV